MALLRFATCIVGGDTGPLHLAVALGTPAVALFGPTDPARNGPYRNPCQSDRVQAQARIPILATATSSSRPQQRHLALAQRSNRSLHAGDSR